MNMKILDQLVAVNLNVMIWTARRKLSAADFGGVSLPPEELASWGSKKICDPEALRIFATLKSRAVHLLDRCGIRFLGGWAIPESAALEINNQLGRLHDEFKNAKELFLGSYDQAVAAWVDKHPGWERLIAASTVGADYVRARLSFAWQFYKVASPEAVVAGNLGGEVASLGQTLFGEIAKEAQVVWGKVYAGKTEVSHKALSPLKAMRRKLMGLSFVEPRVAPVADLIETAMSAVPKRGFIQGSTLVLLQGLVSMLRDPNLLLEHGQKVIDGHSPESVLSSLPVNDITESVIAESTIENAIKVRPDQKFMDSLGLW